MMSDRRADEASIAPHRGLYGSATSESPRRDVVLPPPPEEPLPSKGRKPRAERPKRERVKPVSEPARQTRRARLRLVQVEPWSVMKTAFLLSVAMGIVTVVAVGIVWGVLGAAGLWDSVNSIVQESLGDSTGTPFQIQEYLGTSRVLGFTMIVAVADVVLITAIATLGAFLYNLAATLLGGIELTFAEDS
jgi:hypothetical protein